MVLTYAKNGMQMQLEGHKVFLAQLRSRLLSNGNGGLGCDEESPVFGDLQ
jgi:hypothetical protein